MAFSSLLTLIDDIAAIMDDVAVMTKVAAKKTAGVVGDDLALNANQVTGVRAERELPIIWAVAKGSLINKVILIPMALLLSVFAPFLVVPLLMIGGAYLCFEGVEKLLHKFLHQTEQNDIIAIDMDETDKIKGAIRTDFILSAEIIIIALGVVQNYSTLTKVLVLSLVGVGITVAVYGLVALIVKADDFGAYLLRLGNQLTGKAILWFMPWFMRSLSVVGTMAMFLVGGGIFVHNWGALHDWLHTMHWDTGIMEMLSSLIIGLLLGALCCTLILPILRMFEKRKI